MKKTPLFIFLLFTFNILTSQVIKFDRYSDFLKEHVSHRGFVDYKKVITNINTLEEIAADFSKITPNASWSEDEIKAYWINVYNANLIKLVANYYPVKKVEYIGDPFKREFIPFDGITISLDYIQHQILKELKDPRIHFALYCPADSAPEIKNYALNPKTLNKDLDEIIEDFLANKTKNNFDVKSNSIQISSIFDWYKNEFTNDYNLIDFLNKHQKITTITEATVIKHNEYLWNLPLICPSKQ